MPLGLSVSGIRFDHAAHHARWLSLRIKKPRDHGRQTVCRSLGGKEPNSVPNHSVFSRISQVNSRRQPGSPRKVNRKWQGLENHVASSMVLHGTGSKRTAGTSRHKEPRSAKPSSTRTGNGFAAKTTKKQPSCACTDQVVRRTDAGGLSVVERVDRCPSLRNLSCGSRRIRRRLSG